MYALSEDQNTNITRWLNVCLRSFELLFLASHFKNGWGQRLRSDQLQFEHKWTDNMSHQRQCTHSSYSTSRSRGAIGAGVQAHPQKFWFVKNSSKFAENLGKMGPSVLWFQNMAFNISRKTHKDLFLEVLSKKGLRDLWPLWINFVGKVPQNVIGKFGKFGQISFTPPKICLLLNLCTSTDFKTKTGWCSDTNETESHLE